MLLLRRFLWYCCCAFICPCSSFVVVLQSQFLFDVIPHPFEDYRRVFTTILYFQPSPSQSDSRHFQFQLFRYLLAASAKALSGHFFTHRRSLPYAPSPTFEPAFVKASLEAGSSSLKFAELHTDPWNTGTAHLFVWFTVIHNIHTQDDSGLNSTIY